MSGKEIATTRLLLAIVACLTDLLLAASVLIAYRNASANQWMYEHTLVQQKVANCLKACEAWQWYDDPDLQVLCNESCWKTGEPTSLPSTEWR